MKFQIPNTWKKILKSELESSYIAELKRFLDDELANGETIFPKNQDIFSTLKATNIENIKVVILGQDPYHGDNQAHGLSFSVKPKVKVPPSLANIYKELKSDLNIEIANHGYLQSWADQGVFLLNTVLTVQAHQANSHKKKGWERFTDKLIQVINDECNNVVFLLWGAPAQKKAIMLDNKKHLVLTAPHPSPLSSYRGFFGCKHFSKTNKFLRSKGIAEIKWELPIL